MQKYKKNTTLPNKSHSPVRHSAAFAAVGFCGEAEAERRVVAFASAQRSVRRGGVRWRGGSRAVRERPTWFGAAKRPAAFGLFASACISAK